MGWSILFLCPPLIPLTLLESYWSNNNKNDFLCKESDVFAEIYMTYCSLGVCMRRRIEQVSIVLNTHTWHPLGKAGLHIPFLLNYYVPPTPNLNLHLHLHLHLLHFLKQLSRASFEVLLLDLFHPSVWTGS